MRSDIIRVYRFLLAHIRVAHSNEHGFSIKCMPKNIQEIFTILMILLKSMEALNKFG